MQLNFISDDNLSKIYEVNNEQGVHTINALFSKIRSKLPSDSQISHRIAFHLLLGTMVPNFNPDSFKVNAEHIHFIKNLIEDNRDTIFKNISNSDIIDILLVCEQMITTKITHYEILFEMQRRIGKPFNFTLDEKDNQERIFISYLDNYDYSPPLWEVAWHIIAIYDYTLSNENTISELMIALNLCKQKGFNSIIPYIHYQINILQNTGKPYINYQGFDLSSYDINLLYDIFDEMNKFPDILFEEFVYMLYNSFPINANFTKLVSYHLMHIFPYISLNEDLETSFLYKIQHIFTIRDLIKENSEILYDYDSIMILVNLFIISYMYIYQIQKELVKRGEKGLSFDEYNLGQYYMKTIGEEVDKLDESPILGLICLNTLCCYDRRGTYIDKYLKLQDARMIAQQNGFNTLIEPLQFLETYWYNSALRNMSYDPYQRQPAISSKAM